MFKIVIEHHLKIKHHYTIEMNINDIPRIGIVYRFMIDDYHYTGSTVDTLHSRINNHKSAYKGGGDTQTRKFYQHLVTVGGWDNVKVLILESNVEEEKLKQREQSHINKDDPFCLNAYNVIAPLVPVVKSAKGRTDERKAYDKIYYEAHKEELKKARMERYQQTKADPVKYARLLEVHRQSQARYVAKK